jgi:hypothetical protein
MARVSPANSAYLGHQTHPTYQTHPAYDAKRWFSALAS